MVGIGYRVLPFVRSGSARNVARSRYDARTMHWLAWYLHVSRLNIHRPIGGRPITRAQLGCQVRQGEAIALNRTSHPGGITPLDLYNFVLLSLDCNEEYAKLCVLYLQLCYHSSVFSILSASAAYN